MSRCGLCMLPCSSSCQFCCTGAHRGCRLTIYMNGASQVCGPGAFLLSLFHVVVCHECYWCELQSFMCAAEQ